MGLICHNERSLGDDRPYKCRSRQLSEPACSNRMFWSGKLLPVRLSETNQEAVYSDGSSSYFFGVAFTCG